MAGNSSTSPFIPSYSTSAMSKSSIQHVFDPPPYEAHPAASDNSTYRNHNLYDRLSATRRQHIQLTISTAILPIIHQRAAQGLSHTSIALLPTNITTKSNSHSTSPSPDGQPKVIDIVSSHTKDDDSELQQLELTDQLDTPRFWSQPIVLEELSQYLREWLNPKTGSVEISSDHYQQQLSPSLQSAERQQPKPRGLFSRLSSSSFAPSRTTSHPNVSPPNGKKSFVNENVIVEVTPEEVCLRTQSPFGLYETLIVQAVIIRISLTG